MVCLKTGSQRAIQNFFYVTVTILFCSSVSELYVEKRKAEPKRDKSRTNLIA